MDYSKCKIPYHVAIIIDGNGRWATEKGKSRLKGHDAGFENLKKMAKYIIKNNIKVLSIFTFSTENFKRDKKEVDHLMDLIVYWDKKGLEELNKANIKIVFSGRKDNLEKRVVKAIENITEKTKNNTAGVLNLCFNYGGISEIVDTTKVIASRVLKNEIDINDIDEKLFTENLYQKLPPIDLMIRTSGECRISNFMLFQLAYAELYFPQVYWPDFNEFEFDQAIIEYTKRDRRFGGINNEKKNN